MEFMMKIKMKIKIKYKAFMYIYAPQLDEVKTPSKIIKPVFAKNPQLLAACVSVRA
jgi:hypothetical protein